MAAVNCKCLSFSDHVVQFWCPASFLLQVFLSCSFGFREVISSLLSCVLISLTLLLLPQVLDQSCPRHDQLGAVAEKVGGVVTVKGAHPYALCKVTSSMVVAEAALNASSSHCLPQFAIASCHCCLSAESV